jgi:hypothetical protein
MGAGSATTTPTTSVVCDGTNITLTSPNPPLSTATQPPSTDSSNKMPTTAWVQSAISTGITQKTYTILYTTTQSVTLPTNCIGISVRCVGKGGNSGNADDGNAGYWGAGGSGSGGTTITSLGILPFIEGSVLQLNITTAYSEIISTSIGAFVCRANCGTNGANASGSIGGAGGISDNTLWTVNNGMGAWSALIGSNGPAGGSNLAYQTQSYPLYGGIPVCNNWNPATVYGAGQNWNGFVTNNSYQSPTPISILGGAIWITYYLK